MKKLLTRISLDFRIIPAPLLTVLDLLETGLQKKLNFLKIPYVHTYYEFSLIVVGIYFNNN